jgi:hypothetical protein
MEMDRPCGKNGPALVSTRYVNVGRKNRQKGSTEDPMKEYQEDSGHGQPKTGVNVVDTNNIRKTRITNTAHIGKVATPVHLVTQVPT